MRKAWLLLIVGVVFVTACGSMLTPGSRAVNGPPPAPLAVYSIPYCEVMASGERLSGPQATYFLEQGGTHGMSLYEIEANGRGAKIMNYWVDERGHNFFSFVKTSHAWHFVLPQDRTQPGVRFVYPAGTYTAADVGGRLFKAVAGQPVARCYMAPQ
jgi:hypothetical protein